VKFDRHFLQTIPPEQMRFTLSTMLTLVRVALIPVIVGAILLGHWQSAFVCFIIAALTDTLDGNVARWRNEQTFLGACLDTIADKLLFSAVFLTLALVHPPSFQIPAWFILFVIMREALVVVGALVVMATLHYFVVKPSVEAKAAGFMRTVLVGLILLSSVGTHVPSHLFYVLMYLFIALEVLALSHYVYAGARRLLA